MALSTRPEAQGLGGFGVLALSIIILDLSFSMKRAHAAADKSELSGKRQQSQRTDSLIDLRAELTGAARGTKSSIARVLSILKKRGQLVDDRLGGNTELAHLVHATTKHGDAKTPYGTVIQRFKLADDYILEYVHPCAVIYYLSSIGENVAEFINGVLDRQGTNALDVVVYGDEMTPGSPL